MGKKWYVIHTQSGFENKVKAHLDHRIETLGMQEYISKVFVPSEEIAEIRGGQKRISTRTSFPGYILVEMGLTEFETLFRDFRKFQNSFFTFYEVYIKSIDKNYEYQISPLKDIFN